MDSAWHGYKYIDPKESGAVIPIVHINGFKISERTIYGCCDDKELVALFTGYGYQCRFVEDLEDIDADMAASMEWALREINKIQQAARSGEPIMKPRWPVILLRTPKGWSGPKKVDGEFIEGSFHSHQVPLTRAKTDKNHLKDLSDWLSSYDVRKVLKGNGAPNDSITSILPEDDGKKLGQVKETYDPFHALDVPDWKQFGQKKGSEESCMKITGNLLDAALVQNSSSLRVFSPDEFVSNKLDAAFQHTGRNFQWDEFSNARGGRIIEILSEHTCQGFLQGYTLTGRVGVFPSYESFLGIIHTMMVQYHKFQKMAAEVPWRKSVGSINYIETSTCWRQEHNGFSHQNPSFIGAVLNLKPTAARVYLPPDANTFLSTLHHCLNSRGYVNLMVGSKQVHPVFLSVEEAAAHCAAGASIWKFASVDDGLRPDVVLVGIGAELTLEVVKAAELLRKISPAMRVRVVNVTDLMVLQASGHPHSLTDECVNALFTADKHVHFNYHGYAGEIKGLLYGRPGTGKGRITVDCYKEEGTTTTPYDMLLSNSTSRLHVAQAAVKGAALVNEKVALDMTEVMAHLKGEIASAKPYILAQGDDPQGSYDMPRFDQTKQ